MKIAAVTGAMSGIGRRIVDLLIEQQWHVKILTRKDIRAWHPNLEVVQGDIRDEQVLKTLMKGVSALFHCAAEFAQQELIWEVNVRATEMLLGIAKVSPLNYLCYIGSAGVLGACSDDWVDERTSCHPRDSYEKSKYAAEKMVLSSGLNAKICVLRPVFVVSSQRPGFVEYPIRNDWMDRLKLFIKGRERAHIVHADDIAAAAMFFLEKPLQRPDCFYVSCDEDELNTVAGIAGYYRYLKGGEKGVLKLPASLPVIVPTLVRRLIRGPSLHGRTRFSSARLRAYGFELPLGFKGAIKAMIKDRPE
ncbi:SDR family NAD(P)-dependent oxidoreductase [Mariprofundus ferrooxydans]|nr:SDR family NAD(P)-dependent oxidoreductase [Mariprofundus ferrooxydans]